MALDEDIHGKDPLDEAFETHGITADKLIGDTWKIRNQFKERADSIIDILNDHMGELDDDDIRQYMGDLAYCRKMIEDTDRELRRLMGMYSKDKETQGTFNLIIHDEVKDK